MANRRHVTRLRSGVEAWNAWRRKRHVEPDLSGASLQDMQLGGIDFTLTNLSAADLTNAYLVDANLFDANLREANLTDAVLSDANLSRADLSRAKLTRCRLVRTVLRSADLRRADVTGAFFGETVFGNSNLANVAGLENCRHFFPSTIDHRTFQKSNPLPLQFLRGVGLPDRLVDYLPSLFDQPIQYYSCFISYSTNDHNFAERLHADLQNSGTRCWFAPHDMPIGERIQDEIDAAIRLRDKVLLILSEHSIQSDWVEDEVTKAFEEERTRGRTVLFPIRLDDAVMGTNEAWASKLRARHIGDFTRWKEHDEYQKSFARVLRDLTVKKP